MRNEVIGALFFVLLMFGLLVGILFDQVEVFGFISLFIALGIILFFRKNNRT